jgi:uncharacterized 2Fe-2S/4Fe-4S cluster protein (DUF4445 family)
MTILEKLRRDGVYIDTVCGGQGTCGKCRVLVKKGTDKPSYQLACHAIFTDDMVIDINSLKTEKDFHILEMYEPVKNIENDDETQGYGIAIDIGTTTLAFLMVERSTGSIIASHTRVNSQRALGADVVSRIKLASDGHQDELHRMLVTDIENGIKDLVNDSNHPSFGFNAVAITGNTTMLHLLQNLPCQSLGQYPFTPVTVAAQKRLVMNIDAFILPGISAFVGADIVAGLHFCDTGKDENNILIDLGTNGEMALTTPEKIWVTSTAAGPAFEAGNITHGMGSVPGAVAHIIIQADGAVLYVTIGNKPPLGLCGTGVVSLAAQLIEKNFADETGLLNDEYFNGFPLTDTIFFTQKDMREVQLAKSAVRTGLEILLEEANCKYADIANVYLAGGFGYKMDIHSAVGLGIIPDALKNKVKPLGNTALGGCVNVLINRRVKNEMKAIVKKSTEINLSAHPKFNEYFAEYMLF